jgi:hypothetical protein
VASAKAAIWLLGYLVISSARAPVGSLRVEMTKWPNGQMAEMTKWPNDQTAK